MTKKLSLIRDNHILEADFRGSLCEITIIEIKDQGQSQKYLAKFDVELQNNQMILAQFGTQEEFCQFLKQPTNYMIDFENSCLTLKWKIVAFEFKRRIQYEIKMVRQQMTDKQRLQSEVILLRRKLQEYERAEERRIKRNEKRRKVRNVSDITEEKHENDSRVNSRNRSNEYNREQSDPPKPAKRRYVRTKVAETKTKPIRKADARQKQRRQKQNIYSSSESEEEIDGNKLQVSDNYGDSLCSSSEQEDDISQSVKDGLQDKNKSILQRRVKRANGIFYQAEQKQEQKNNMEEQVPVKIEKQIQQYKQTCKQADRHRNSQNNLNSNSKIMNGNRNGNLDNAYVSNYINGNGNIRITQSGKDVLEHKQLNQKKIVNQFQDVNSNSNIQNLQSRTDNKKQQEKQTINQDHQNKSLDIKEQQSDHEGQSGGDKKKLYTKTVVGDKVRIEFQNGDYYLGHLKKNVFHGDGLYYSKINGTYNGEWKQGKANGFGTSIDSEGNKYQGMFMNDIRHGKGKDEYSNGQKYVGQFNQGTKQGYGVYYYRNGDHYQGQWKNDMCDGYGQQFYSDGTSYKGNWKQDQKHGQGIFSNKAGQVKQWYDMGNLIKQQQLTNKQGNQN